MEVNILLFLQQLRGQAPDLINGILNAVSDFMISPIPLVAIVLVMWCVNKRAGYFMLFSVTCASGVMQILKNTFCIYRPWILDARITPDPAALSGATGYSFPSGHTTLATSTFGSLAIWLRKRVWVVALCVVAILLVGFSRMWLGCHMPKDVICAIIFATITLAVARFLFTYIEKHPEKDIVIAVVGMAVSVILLIFCSLKAYPVDFDAAGNILANPIDMTPDCYRAYGSTFALFLGWIIERRFIHFSAEGTTRARIIRGVVGAAIAGALFAACSAFLPTVLNNDWYHFVKYFLLMIYATAIWPAVFTKIEGLSR